MVVAPSCCRQHCHCSQSFVAAAESVAKTMGDLRKASRRHHYSMTRPKTSKKREAYFVFCVLPQTYVVFCLRVVITRQRHNEKRERKLVGHEFFVCNFRFGFQLILDLIDSVTDLLRIPPISMGHKKLKQHTISQSKASFLNG